MVEPRKIPSFSFPFFVNRNIFGKLQVQNRTEAVARARELGLL